MVRFALLAIAGVTAFAASSLTAAPSAEAAPLCRPSIEGSAAGLGVLGRGSRRARIRAQSNWEQRVQEAYGERFARFSAARAVVWNCRGGTLAPATCTVRARPCRR